MPSTFPEAFGMVAAEAAACGALPLSAAHSGMAEVDAPRSRPRCRAELRPLLSFERRAGPVEQIAAKLIAWLTLDPGRARPRPGRAGGRGGRAATRGRAWPRG